MMNYWVNFAYYLDPNGDMTDNPRVHTTNTTVTYKKGNWKNPAVRERGRDDKKKGGRTAKGGKHALERTVWRPHGFPENKNAMLFAPGNFTVIQDDYREEQMQVFEGPAMAKDLNYRRDIG